MKHRARWLLAVPAFVVLVIYLPSLRHGFVWDDTIFLQDMPIYRHPALWVQALSEPFVLSPNYWRPLGVILFGLQLRASTLLGGSGLDPALLHGINLLLHLANTTLVALLARALLEDEAKEDAQPWLALGAALIYGLHPALIEGVAFISSQFDLLVTLLLLLGLLADVRLRGARRPIIVGLCFFAAALAKEMAVTFVVVLPLWHLARRNAARRNAARRNAARRNAARRNKERSDPSHSDARRRLWPPSALWHDLWDSGDLFTYLAVGVAGAAYLALRYAVLGYLLVPTSGALPVGNPLQHLLLVARSLARYIVLVFWPFTTLTPIHYSTLPVPAYDLAAWASLIVLAGVGLGLVALVRRAPRSGWMLAAGALSLLPVSNILPLELDGGAFVAERFLLFPLSLLVLGLASLARSLASWLARAWISLPWTEKAARFPTYVVPLLWLLASVVTVQLVLPNWHDDLTLWTWGSRRAPLSPTPPMNLSLAYANMNSSERAIAESNRALQLAPEEANAWNNLGLALFYRGDQESAQQAFQEAVRLEPENAVYWNNLAATFREQGQLEEAEKMLLEKVLTLDPVLPVGHLNLGVVYRLSGRPDLALPHLQEALALLPPGQTGEAEAQLAELQKPEPWIDLGARFLAEADPQAALAAYQQAEQFGAQPTAVVPGMSRALIELDALDEAGDLIGRFIEQAPDDARLYLNLGLIAQKQGDLERAQAYLERAAELAPQWEEPQQLLQSLGTQ